MTRHSRNLALLAFIAAGLTPATSALAQSFSEAYASPPPLYPYVVQPNQPHAIHVAPKSHASHHAAHTRDHLKVRCRNCGHRAVIAGPEKAAPRLDRSHKPVDRKLVDELGKHSRKTGSVVNTTKIVREAPVIVETKRYVDDPPRVIERRRAIEDGPVRSHRTQAATQDVDTGQAASRDDGKQRVIHAEAEITIVGSDRMNIRLYRKRHGPNAKAQADK